MSFTRYESLAGRVAIITGGASGIGESFVRAFAANAARVAFLDLQEDAGNALARSLQDAAHAPLFVPCDLTDPAALRVALARVRRELGPAAVLVNNAANDQRQNFQEVTPDQFDWMMAVNLRHVYFACQAIVPQMIERFSEKYPRAVLYVDNVPTFSDALPALRSRQYDLVFARLYQPLTNVADDLNVERLFDDPVVVVAGRDNPFARRRKVDLADLVDEPWILMPSDSWNTKMVADAFRARGLAPPKATQRRGA